LWHDVQVMADPVRGSLAGAWYGWVCVFETSWQGDAQARLRLDQDAGVGAAVRRVAGVAVLHVRVLVRALEHLAVVAGGAGLLHVGPAEQRLRVAAVRRVDSSGKTRRS
jgi:hypothetical protein